MSHLEMGAALPKHIISYEKQALKQARKEVILWTTGSFMATAAWAIIGFMFMPQGIVQTIAGVLMLLPLIVMAVQTAGKRRVYDPLKKDAQFINDGKLVFGNWMRDATINRGSSFVDIDVSMSSAKPGVLCVVIYWLMDAASRPRHPEFAPMVFEIGDDFFSSYGADPRKVMPVLLNSISSDEASRQNGRNLEQFFERQSVPVTSHQRSSHVGIIGD